MGGTEANKNVAGVEQAERLERRLISARVELPIQTVGFVASPGVVDHNVHRLLACRTCEVWEVQHRLEEKNDCVVILYTT